MAEALGTNSKKRRIDKGCESKNAPLICVAIILKFSQLSKDDDDMLKPQQKNDECEPSEEESK
jgi:hypothetical protein